MRTLLVLGLLGLYGVNAVFDEACNHTCETILTMVNKVYEEHKRLPKRLATTADNYRTNKSWLVLGFLGGYVVNCVLRKSASSRAASDFPKLLQAARQKDRTAVDTQN